MSRWVLRCGEREWLLSTGKFEIGRAPTCDIRLDNFRVSRVHAELVVTPAGVHIADRSSANGVWVNGRPIEDEDSVTIKAGDRVAIGGVDVELVRAQSDPPGFAQVVTRPMSVIPTAHRPDSKPAPSPLDQLSGREREVLSLYAAGFDQREIASQLRLSIKTIETYRARIGDKLGIRSRAEMVRLALNAGLLRPG